MIHRVPADIGVEVHAAGVADGVGLEELAEAGGVEPGLVIVEAQRGDIGLPFGHFEPFEHRTLEAGLHSARCKCYRMNFVIRSSTRTAQYLPIPLSIDSHWDALLALFV